MRLRPIAALSAAALAAVLLAGCAPPEAEPQPSATETLCDAAVESGAASDAVTVEGDPGKESKVNFDEPLDVPELQRTVISEGSGDQAAEGDYVGYAMTAFDATTGEKLGSLGYAEGELLPQPVSTDTGLAQVFGCASVGSRIIAAYPASDASPEPLVYVFDLMSITPLAAWGEAQDAPAGMPAVEIGEDGTPSITVPEADAPTEVELATLKQGDGVTVQPGDTVLVQYHGVKWSDGSVFDSSWQNGAPVSLSTDGVVEGFGQAMEDHEVGSQVLVVVPPEFGYGPQEGHELQEETLVFVVDILATQRPAP